MGAVCVSFCTSTSTFALIAEETTAKTLFPLEFRMFQVSVVTNVSPVPLVSSKKLDVVFLEKRDWYWN